MLAHDFANYVDQLLAEGTTNPAERLRAIAKELLELADALDPADRQKGVAGTNRAEKPPRTVIGKKGSPDAQP